MVILFVAFRGACGQELLGEPALVIEAGLSGNEDFGGAGGMDFIVHSAIDVFELGAFDSDSDGLARRITVELWSRKDGGTPDDPFDDTGGEKLASVKLRGDEGALAVSTRFLSLEEPVRLEPGPYTIVAWGYGTTEQAYNVGGDDAEDHGLTVTTSELITFVGESRFGDVATNGSFPDQVDGGPANRYGAGNFTFADAAGTDATAPFDVGEVTIAKPNGEGAPAQVQLTWPSRPDESFTVEQSADMTDWLEVADGYPSGGDATVFEFELPAEMPHRLYWRARRE